MGLEAAKERGKGMRILELALEGWRGADVGVRLELWEIGLSADRDACCGDRISAVVAATVWGGLRGGKGRINTSISSTPSLSLSRPLSQSLSLSRTKNGLCRIFCAAPPAPAPPIRVPSQQKQ